MNPALSINDPASVPISRWPRVIELASFGSFLLSVLLGLLLPVYTDEIGWRMQERAGLDGGVDRLLSDICGPNTIAAPPLFMMPVRHASAWLNLTFPDPLYVRLIGVAGALCWAFLLRTLIGRIAAGPRQGQLLRTLVFALLGLGVLPLMLVMSRPDQAVLLAITAALLATVIAAKQTDGPAWSRWLWPLLVVLLGMAAISFHLKGILLAPLFLVCLCFAGRGKRTLAPRLLGIVLFAALAWQAADYWVGRFRCPGDPVLAGRLAEQNLASAMAGQGNWRDKALVAIRGADPNGYIMLAEARKSPMSTWLPYGRIDQQATLLRYLPMSLAWNAAMLIGLICLVRALQTRWRERRIDLAVAAPVVLAGLVLVWGMSQLTKNDYEAMVVLPLLAIFATFSLAAVPWPAARTRQIGFAASLLAGISIVAQADIVRRYFPPLWQAAEQAGYVEGQGFSVSVFGYGSIREQIRGTARQCGIGAHGRAQHPLVDDTTYFAMTDSWRPYHVLGVFEKWNGSISNPLAYLKTQGSEGMIVGCRLLGPDLLRMSIRHGDFCCISTR